MTGDDRRLIEDVMPIGVISAIAAREKSHPKHPVSLVHYWPARRPPTACRSAIYAALIAAPQSQEERVEAIRFQEKLAALELDPEVLANARAAVLSSYDGHAPKLLDMFSGGGGIPLEAARLGCDSYALEYNPVAHIIELCTLKYPQVFGCELAQDVARAGDTLIERLRADIGDLYPDVEGQPGIGVETSCVWGDSAASSGAQQVMAYIWVRTVPCCKPGCSAIVPLVRHSWLRKKQGDFAVARPRLCECQGGIAWDIVRGRDLDDIGSQSLEQTGSGEAVCLSCATPLTAAYVKEQAIAGMMNDSLAAVVTPGSRSREYHPPSAVEMPSDMSLSARLADVIAASNSSHPEELLQGKLRDQLPSYGFDRFEHLFSARQMLVHTEMVKHIRELHRDMMSGGVDPDRATAVVAYLAMAFGRVLNHLNKFCRWESHIQLTKAAIGDRQALKMVYDFVEINPLAETAGCLSFAIRNLVFSIRELAKVGRPCTVIRGNAEMLPWADETFDVVVTDPPYYSSIFYADLSSFFYVWLRRVLGDLFPEHFVLPTPPKRREAVAQRSEHGGNAEDAEKHYRDVMGRAFSEARRVLKPHAPLVCVYSHKSTDGWASLIKALIAAGLTVTEAWPLQTEARGRSNARGTASLSDSIFIVARRRETADTGGYETDVLPELERIAEERIVTLWANGEGIGGADLLMAAVGAGLRPFTQFGRVELANGEEVTADHYLRVVQGVVMDTMLEHVFGLSRSAVATVDRLSRFYVLWRFTYQESSIESGDAIVFCYPQGISMDGPDGIAGPLPRLVEKVKSTYRVRTFQERGSIEVLGAARGDGTVAPLVDVLHRLLWLIENGPRQIPAFLKGCQVNLEQLRAVAEAIQGPKTRRNDSWG
ncbi:MAG: DUF1156 domain-containing protein, partial [Polyangiaceae bacterium]|nr:DUF1156 domain-containing protein [Polyangiaceae bacterium]